MIDIKVGDKVKLSYGGDPVKITKIDGPMVYYITKSGSGSWFHISNIDEGRIEIIKKTPRLTLKQLKSKKQKIIKEIKANPDFSKQFTNVQKEVGSWSEVQINNWFK